jgi:DNA-directed RNA polymerase specialized sigma subunit
MQKNTLCNGVSLVNQTEIIKLTDKWLNYVPDIRIKIKLIDTSLRDDICNDTNVDKIIKERYRLNSKLSMIIKSVATLDEENQRIICYKYFDKFSDRVTALRVGYSKETIPRRIKKDLLNIGRVLFGYEDEFWDEIIEPFAANPNSLLFKVMKEM